MSEQQIDRELIFARLHAAKTAADMRQNAGVLARIATAKVVASALADLGFVLERVVVGRLNPQVWVEHTPACDRLAAGAYRIDTRGTVMATTIDGVQVHWLIPKSPARLAS